MYRSSSLLLYYYLLDALKHGFGFYRRVVWSEVLVLFHLLLKRQVLLLQPVPQARQRLPDMVGQLLIQNLLKIGGPKTVCHVTVRGVTVQKKNRLSGERIRSGD